MNPLLEVKLRFAHEQSPNKPGPRNLRSEATTTVEKIDSLIEDLRTVLRYYRNVPQVINGILIDVNYNDIIAKSNRIQVLLKPDRQPVNNVVVGARFSDAPEGEENHIITYYVGAATVEKTIRDMELARRFLTEKLSGRATRQNFNEPGTQLTYDGYGVSKTTIRNIIVDCSVVESFSVPRINVIQDKESYLITFFKTEVPIESLFEKLDIDDFKYHYDLHGRDTVSVTKDLFDILNSKVPYMISMISSDLSKVTLDEVMEDHTVEVYDIPDPSTEPTIGVIDTLFDENVYFSKWVQNVDYISDIEKDISRDDPREHGTEVTSIIVDGPRMNPWLDDGCGRFRVKHFGICADRIPTLRLVNKIKEIVLRNPDIHVWNLSLGTEDEVSKNYISFDAAALDELQAKRNIIFVISGTNDNRENQPDTIRVGSPADSLNAVVVNSVRRNNRPASYSRKGNILSFFNKPDVSYYGGDYDERIIAYSPCAGDTYVYGTSFAAPWISRKLCYLIDVMGLPREVAKALIIDSAAAWEYKQSTYRQKDIIGYGVVPIDINRVLASDNEEIKFVVYDTAKTYKTTNYAIPVPRDENNKYPYIARATLCYFPPCSRSQGVDYTNRELSLQFGRINKAGKIDDINENNQDEDSAHINERTSRKEFRKWENTKFISKILKNNRPLISYDERLWGIAITSKARLSSKANEHMNFGAVITLREVNGVNRIQDFIQACTLRGWIVNSLDVQARIEVYNANQEDIHFD